MKTLRIQIPDMHSSHCQTRVSNALKEIHGVKLEAVQPGTVSVSMDEGANQSTITGAITDAGYQVAGIESSVMADDTHKFKTNINCSGCVAKVTPVLDGLDATWSVDTESKDKVLTVSSKEVSGPQIMDAVQKAGFRIEPLNN